MPARARKQRSRRSAPQRAPLLAYLRHRHDTVTSAFLVFPLFLAYQLGILFGAQGRNGVDLITGFLVWLCERDLSLYLAMMAVMTLGYVGLVQWLRRQGRPEVTAFGPMLVESSVYALLMGSAILAVIREVAPFVPGLAIGGAEVLDVVVISAGAGLHEELIFRAGLMGGLAAFFRPLGVWRGFWLAVAISSLFFAAVHHVGPGSDPFGALPFAYRTLAGVWFAVLYRWRGFAVAAWTHALYDIYVIGFAG